MINKSIAQRPFSILVSIIKLHKYHNEVYIHLMCKGAHVRGEYRYKDVSPILNKHGIGGSRMYPTQVQNLI